MRSTILSVAVLVASGSALASAPKFDRDPFEDGDFVDAPLILDTAHPTRGRGELGVMFAGSLVNSYNAHRGALIDFNYHITNTIGVALSVGYLNGQLTPIVKDERGILGNRVTTCITDGCASLDPDVPNYRQITGMVDAMMVWSPLYGKLNLVSELDVNLQFYTAAGVGVNGTRTVEATLDSAAATGYSLSSQGMGAGGFFGDPFFNIVAAVGVKIFITDWLDLRGEVRGLFFRDKFDFSGDGALEGYWASTVFGHVGLGFILF